MSDLRAGDMLAAEGRLDEALAVYHRFIAIWRAKRADGTSIRAADQMARVLAQIGGLASGFLLAGRFELARTCAEESLAERPNSVALNLTRAHALMFLGLDQEAREIFLLYRGKRMSSRGKSCGAFISETFIELRQAGLVHPLMEEVEGWLVETEETNAQPTDSESLGELESAPADDLSPVAATMPPSIEMGDNFVSRNELEEALASYRQGVTLCEARISGDSTDAQARDEMDLGVGRIGHVAFLFLLSRNTQRALEVIEESLVYRPDRLRLHLIHAHVFMLRAGITAALNVHRKYRGQTLRSGHSWGAAIRSDFAALRQSRYNLPVMDEIERQFAKT